jgi:hypothetical protein
VLNHLVQIIWFPEKHVGDIAQRLFRPAAGSHHQLEPRKSRMNEFCQPSAVHPPGHADIGEQQVDRQGTFQNGQGVFRIRGFKDVQALAAQSTSSSTTRTVGLSGATATGMANM